GSGRVGITEIALEFLSPDHTPAERGTLLALRVLLAQALASLARRGVPAGIFSFRDLGHRLHAGRERSSLDTLDVLLALALAVLAISLGFGGLAGLRTRRMVRVVGRHGRGGGECQ